MDTRLLSLANLIAIFGESETQALLDSFVCREEVIEKYCKVAAIKNENTNFTRTYVYLKPSFDTSTLQVQIQVVGLFSIQPGFVDGPAMPDTILGKKSVKRVSNSKIQHFDKKRVLPAYNIRILGKTENATDISGKEMLDDCLTIFRLSKANIGGDTVLLKCKRILFQKFYSKYQFALLGPKSESDKKVNQQKDDDELYVGRHLDIV
ncbi:hypothetical protein [Convivina intestini]|uniref:hypothetical protein n=1 Tax=Convivina intestini TaxID=1505726 RepID=UPI00200E2730|nr:hypothetical protein [Convivina intestini]CAH1856491.1 hypothetical protein R078131_01413 [Convivina intestini]